MKLWQFDTLPFNQKMAPKVVGKVLEGSALINLLKPAKQTIAGQCAHFKEEESDTTNRRRPTNWESYQ